MSELLESVAYNHSYKLILLLIGLTYFYSQVAIVFVYTIIGPNVLQVYST